MGGGLAGVVGALGDEEVGAADGLGIVATTGCAMIDGGLSGAVAVAGAGLNTTGAGRASSASRCCRTVVVVDVRCTAAALSARRSSAMSALTPTCATRRVLATGRGEVTMASRCVSVG